MFSNLEKCHHVSVTVKVEVVQCKSRVMPYLLKSYLSLKIQVVEYGVGMELSVQDKFSHSISLTYIVLCMHVLLTETLMHSDICSYCFSLIS